MPDQAPASISESTHFAELTRAMTMLGVDRDTLFVGQAVRYPGTAMYGTLEGVPLEKRIELPVAEEMQMGQSIGLAMMGYTVVSIYPRFNFLLCAVNQLVNHLDKICAMSGGGYRPRVIVRTAVGSVVPLDPQHQHRGDFTHAMRAMLSSVVVQELTHACDIVPAYRRALTRPDARSTLLIEYADSYGST
jgi:pyruvate/2-oxoglutarate/acetoin dehydrogenase E1 component